VRNDYASGRNESVRLPEIRLPHVTDEVISEIRAVGKVKDLEDGLKVGPLSDLEILSESRVKLEERLSAGIVKGGD